MIANDCALYVMSTSCSSCGSGQEFIVHFPHVIRSDALFHPSSMLQHVSQGRTESHPRFLSHKSSFGLEQSNSSWPCRCVTIVIVAKHVIRSTLHCGVSLWFSFQSYSSIMNQFAETNYYIFLHDVTSVPTVYTHALNHGTYYPL